ncbi:MAG: hypothetical protein AAF938_12625 [Myxococcota bacterium]
MTAPLPNDTFAFDYSYILGWRRGEDEVRVFVELRVLPGNVHFRSFDESKEVGCYVVGTLVFRGVSDVSGLAVDCHPVKRGSPDEFTDVAEIDRLEFDGGRVRIEADGFAFAWSCASAEFELGSRDWMFEGDGEATF